MSWAKLNIKCHCVGVSLPVEYVTQWSVRVASCRVAISVFAIATLQDATANTSYPSPGRDALAFGFSKGVCNDELFLIGLTQKLPKSLIYRRHVVACRRLPPYLREASVNANAQRLLKKRRIVECA